MEHFQYLHEYPAVESPQSLSVSPVRLGINQALTKLPHTAATVPSPQQLAVPKEGEIEPPELLLFDATTTNTNNNQNQSTGGEQDHQSTDMQEVMLILQQFAASQAKFQCTVLQRLDALESAVAGVKAQQEEFQKRLGAKSMSSASRPQHPQNHHVVGGGLKKKSVCIQEENNTVHEPIAPPVDMMTSCTQPPPRRATTMTAAASVGKGGDKTGRTTPPPPPPPPNNTQQQSGGNAPSPASPDATHVECPVCWKLVHKSIATDHVNQHFTNTQQPQQQQQQQQQVGRIIHDGPRTSPVTNAALQRGPRVSQTAPPQQQQQQQGIPKSTTSPSSPTTYQGGSAAPNNGGRLVLQTGGGVHHHHDVTKPLNDHNKGGGGQGLDGLWNRLANVLK